MSVPDPVIVIPRLNERESIAELLGIQSLAQSAWAMWAMRFGRH